MENSTDPDFATFWNLYPRKVAKKDAEKAWKKLTAPEKAQAIEAIPKHAAKWDEKQFVPHASTWLNGARWEDEVEDVRPQLKQQTTAWWSTHEGVEKKARELRMTARSGESWAQFKERVMAAEQAKRAIDAARATT